MKEKITLNIVLKPFLKVYRSIVQCCSFLLHSKVNLLCVCVCVCVCVCLHTYVYCVLSHSVMSNSAAHYCSPPGFSVHRILQERILEWAAISSSRVSSHPRDSTRVSYISGRFFTLPATRKACVYKYPSSLDFFPFRSPQSIE